MSFFTSTNTFVLSTAAWLYSSCIKLTSVLLDRWIQLLRQFHTLNFKIIFNAEDIVMYRDDYRRGMDWWMDLLTTCTHDSELQVITLLSLITTLYKSPQHTLRPFPGYCPFMSRSLATASNSGDSSASRALVLSPWLGPPHFGFLRATVNLAPIGSFCFLIG
jgi:hypothetical protein